MNRLVQKRVNSKRRARRVAAKIRGSAERPRLSVHTSNLHVMAQIIDDGKGVTLAYATSVGHKDGGGTMTEKAAIVGQEIASKARKARIKKVVFDRGGRKYHGRIKALADAARKEGLEF